MLKLLEEMQSKQCSFARDRVYSLLALPKGGSNIDVDDRQSDGAFSAGYAKRLPPLLLSIRLLEIVYHIWPPTTDPYSEFVKLYVFCEYAEQEWVINRLCNWSILGPN